MGETRSEPPKIKVVDRRKFSAEGDPLETAVPTAETTAPAPPPEELMSESAAPTPESGPATAAPEHRGQPSQLFLELGDNDSGSCVGVEVGTRVPAIQVTIRSKRKRDVL